MENSVLTGKCKAKGKKTKQCTMISKFVSQGVWVKKSENFTYILWLNIQVN